MHAGPNEAVDRLEQQDRLIRAIAARGLRVHAAASGVIIAITAGLLVHGIAPALAIAAMGARDGRGWPQDAFGAATVSGRPGSPRGPFTAFPGLLTEAQNRNAMQEGHHGRF